MSQTIAATELRPEDVLLVAGRIRMRVEGVKIRSVYDDDEHRDRSGLPSAVTVYVRGPDGLRDSYQYSETQTVEVDRG